VARAASGQSAGFVKVMKVSQGKYAATHAATETGALACGTWTRLGAPVTEIGTDLAATTCRFCREQLGLDDDTDTSRRLEALFVLSITLGLRPGELRELWLIRMSGTAELRPSAGHLGDAAACRAAARSATTAATGAEFPRRGERDVPDQERQPAARVAGPSAIPARGQRDQAVPEAGAVNDAAVAAYRLSAQAGNPLSERKLAHMFGRTSRRWARARIADARRVPSSGLMVDPAVTVGAQSR
jgi:hypothetical protein